jgi:hypothetical protein
MGPQLGLAVLLLGMTGCAALERDVGVYTVWAKRGQRLGDLAHVYCEQGAARERLVMTWAMERAAYPAQVSIACPAD